MVCRNICERLDVLSSNNDNNNTGGLGSSSITYHYLAGQKYCRRCDIFMFYDKGIFCPCCGMQLRTTPTTKTAKEKLMKYRLKQKKEEGKQKEALTYLWVYIHLYV
jgi:hypothetical protein